VADREQDIELVAFDWVPDFARGFVRDLRPRWACEETGLPYRSRLISAVERPADHYADQPWGQVPVLRDGGVTLFESGAILLHLGEKDERLLPREPQARASAISWLFAAFNSVEPFVFELSNVGGRLDRMSDALGEREYLAGRFSVADIAMATVLRELGETDLVSSRPALQAYLDRCLARPAFGRALKAQLADFKPDS
jgi:glutathione S-transferase